MRKLIAFLLICFFSFLFKNERASCKTHCLSESKIIKKNSVHKNFDVDSNASWIYEGFFFKI